MYFFSLPLTILSCHVWDCLDLPLVTVDAGTSRAVSASCCSNDVQTTTCQARLVLDACSGTQSSRLHVGCPVPSLAARADAAHRPQLCCFNKALVMQQCRCDSHGHLPDFQVHFPCFLHTKYWKQMRNPAPHRQETNGAKSKSLQSRASSALLLTGRQESLQELCQFRRQMLCSRGYQAAWKLMSALQPISDGITQSHGWLTGCGFDPWQTATCCR